MKIHCDVCNKEEAAVFCTADEAALCDGCDHHVHHANKLASKHQRFSLRKPSSNQYPLCDICKEKRAFMFCQQDRAILCKECDFSIHSSNEFTQKHDRFLLTGVKLSIAPKLYSCSSTPSNSVLTTASDSSKSKASSSSNLSSNQPLITKNNPLSPSTLLPLPSATNATLTKVAMKGTDSTSTRSISEYLIETLPGWQVEDFLDSYSVPFGFCKNDDMLPMFDAGIEGNLGSMGIWVPQAPPPQYSQQMDGVIVQSEVNNIKGNNRSRLRDDNNFTVPQISPDSNSKRPRQDFYGRK